MPKISPRPQPGAKTFKFLHISDIHVDHLYTPTGNPVCDDIMCCRVETDIDPAPYGRLAHCDIPVTTFELALKQMSQMDFDFAIWTGDNLPHDIW